MPLLVSSNWAASILGLLTFGFTELVLYVTTEPKERKVRLTRNVVTGFLVTCFVYGVLFVWSMIQTVYDDHHDETGRWQAVVKEKDTLKTELSKKDRYITELEAKGACSHCPTRPDSLMAETSYWQSIIAVYGGAHRSGILMWLTIWNSGPPTIVHGYRLHLVVDGKEMEGKPEVISPDMTYFNYTGKTSRYHDDELIDKTVSPISSGGQVTGALLFVFAEDANLTDEKLSHKGTKLQLSFFDVWNKEHTFPIQTNGPLSQRPPYIPGAKTNEN